MLAAISLWVSGALASPVSVGPSEITISRLSLRGEIVLGVAPWMASGNATLVTPSATASDALGVTVSTWSKAGSGTGGWGAAGEAGLAARSGMHHLSVGSRPCGASTSGPTSCFGHAPVSGEAAGGGTAETSSLFIARHRIAKGQSFPPPIPCAGWSPWPAHPESHAPARTLQWWWSRG